MIKRVINFLDKHRVLLVLIILLIVIFLFIGIKSLIFLNHNFKNFECTKNIDETYCYHNDSQIFINPKKEKNSFFKEKKEEITKLKEDYNLPEFNFYTSYYYETAALFHYKETDEDEDLWLFFNSYNVSYDINNFYRDNVLFFALFYQYKIL